MLLGGKREWVVNRWGRKFEGFGVYWAVWAHGTEDARVSASLVLDIFSVGEASFICGGDEEGVVVGQVVSV
jgi:hypothetical protein